MYELYVWSCGSFCREEDLEFFLSFMSDDFHILEIDENETRDEEDIVYEYVHSVNLGESCEQRRKL